MSSNDFNPADLWAQYADNVDIDPSIVSGEENDGQEMQRQQNSPHPQPQPFGWTNIDGQMNGQINDHMNSHVAVPAPWGQISHPSDQSFAMNGMPLLVPGHAGHHQPSFFPPPVNPQLPGFNPHATQRGYNPQATQPGFNLQAQQPVLSHQHPEFNPHALQHLNAALQPPVAAGAVARSGTPRGARRQRPQLHSNPAHPGMMTAQATNNRKRSFSEMDEDESDDHPKVKIPRAPRLRSPADSDKLARPMGDTSRTGQACDRCKNRKIKCDNGNDSCLHCTQLNVECMVTDRATGVKAPRNALRKATERRSELELFIKTHGYEAEFDKWLEERHRKGAEEAAVPFENSVGEAEKREVGGPANGSKEIETFQRAAQRPETVERPRNAAPTAPAAPTFDTVERSETAEWFEKESELEEGLGL